MKWKFFEIFCHSYSNDEHTIKDVYLWIFVLQSAFPTRKVAIKKTQWCSRPVPGMGCLRLDGLELEHTPVGLPHWLHPMHGESNKALQNWYQSCSNYIFTSCWGFAGDTDETLAGEGETKASTGPSGCQHKMVTSIKKWTTYWLMICLPW